MKFVRLLARDFNRMIGEGPLPSWHGTSIWVILALGAVMLLAWALMMAYMLP